MKNIKKLMVLFMVILVSYGCSTNDDPIDSSIVGQWQLIKTGGYGVNNNGETEYSITDYSDKNVLYDFKKDSILIVASGNDTEQFSYTFEMDYLTSSPSQGESKIQLVKIDGSKYTYSFTNGTMILGQSYVDGGDLFFQRR